MVPESLLPCTRRSDGHILQAADQGLAEGLEAPRRERRRPLRPYTQEPSELRVEAVEDDRAVARPLLALGETRMPYKAASPDDPALAQMNFEQAYFSPISGVLADYVATDQGAGAVHAAPSHGADDFCTGARYGLDQTCNVDEAGHIHNGLPEYDGKTVFKANEPIVELLRTRGVLLGRDANGGFAEYVTAPASHEFCLPNGIESRTAPLLHMPSIIFGEETAALAHPSCARNVL